ncbi:MAG: redoxin domain-containing protein [Planctomycetes bacterium]|nr:redoxin domain-containing protein [Planctomycetota bacterium]
MRLRTLAPLLLLALIPALAQDTPAPIPQPWPPAVDQAYPDLELKNHKGETVKLSDFRGKVIIVEPIGMNCPACQAFVGANTELGPYGNNRPQAGLKSFDEYLEEVGGVKPSDRGIVYVQLLLYDMSNRKEPTVEDAAKWVEHFELEGRKNTVVLVGDARYVNQASWNLVPGFQLIDKNFVLRYDASGHSPKHDLGLLLRQVKPLLEERAKPKR